MTRFRPVLYVAAMLLACGSEHEQGNGGTSPAGVELASSPLSRNRAASDANVPALAAGNRAFAFDLLHQLSSANTGKNLVFSPFSISTALAMTYAGARGETAAEMKRTLHFELEQPALHEAFNAVDLTLASRGEGKAGADGTPFRLNVNNSIWTQRGFPVEAAFLDTLALHYGAGVFLADFATNPEGARSAINRWVEERTERLIPELLPMGSIDPSTVFVLTNTVYFNASWKTKFEEEQTQPAPFHKPDGSTVQVEMMNAGLNGVSYAKGDRYEAVALPYASEELAFVAVLPEAGAYEDVERAANATWFSELSGQLSPSSVQLAVPKLDTKTATSLAPTLKALGMDRPFGGADFSGLTSGSVAIDDVIHEAVLKLFEGGTIAAAATAVIIRANSKPQFDHTVRFDRPFLYAIVDRPTGHILFLGRVLDPSVQ